MFQNSKKKKRGNIVHTYSTDIWHKSTLSVPDGVLLHYSRLED